MSYLSSILMGVHAHPEQKALGGIRSVLWNVLHLLTCSGASRSQPESRGSGLTFWATTLLCQTPVCHGEGEGA